jgi:uncharacterized membrane protein YccC
VILSRGLATLGVGLGFGRGQAPADLARLPIGFDLRAVSVAEGLRAGLSVAMLVALSEVLSAPLLIEAALAALLTCLCDAGGPIRRRTPWLLGFGVLGAGSTFAFGCLGALPLWLLLPLAAFALFCTSYSRIYGQLQIGNLLAVVIVLALDQPMPTRTALAISLWFLAGNLWAVLLTMVIWRVHPYGPARRAVAEAYRRLAALVGDLRDVVRHPAAEAAFWEAHARGHRRAVREAIELARAAVRDTLRGRGQVLGRTGQSLLRVETADQIFGALIALSELLEAPCDAAAKRNAERMLRLLRPLLTILAHAAETDEALRTERLERTIGDIAAAGAQLPAPMPRVAGVIVERLRIAATLAAPENFMPGGVPDGEASIGLGQRLLTPLRANFTWQSTVLRHATRVAVMAIPALAITHLWPSTYGHWLTITLVVTMQPIFATTWQRALERIGGTVLGGFLGTALAGVLTSPLAAALAMFPLAIVTFMFRATSFALMITFLTPLVVLLIEVAAPGTSGLSIALWRALYTVIGGALAVFGCLVLWPSWEPGRLREGLAAALDAHAAYAEAELSLVLGEVTSAAVDEARRAAGLASNNLETSVTRALQEPRPPEADEMEAVMVIDAALRRFAGRLSAMQLSQGRAGAQDAEAWRDWRAWFAASLRLLASLVAAITDHAQRPPLPPRPARVPNAALSRMARQLELIDGALRHFVQPAPRAAAAAAEPLGVRAPA